jgi:hypothetical protein
VYYREYSFQELNSQVSFLFSWVWWVFPVLVVDEELVLRIREVLEEMIV